MRVLNPGAGVFTASILFYFILLTEPPRQPWIFFFCLFLKLATAYRAVLSVLFVCVCVCGGSSQTPLLSGSGLPACDFLLHSGLGYSRLQVQSD